MIGLLMLLAAAGPAPAGATLITNPDWAGLPSADNLADLYPSEARDFGVTGRAEIRCKVLAAGGLTDCQVVSESPAGLGFGAATLNAAPYFQMRPRTVDGAPVAGGVVTIPLRWRLAGDDRRAPSAADVSAAATCLGLAQAQADRARSRDAISAAAGFSEVFGQAAGQAGLKPSQMLAKRREALAASTGHEAETTAQDAAMGCSASFGLEWAPLQPDPSAPAPPPPAPPARLAGFIVETRTRSETCVSALAGELERSAAPAEADQRAFAAWTKTFTWTSLWGGRTSAEINDRLAALAKDGERRRDERTLAQCRAGSEDAPPVG